MNDCQADRDFSQLPPGAIELPRNPRRFADKAYIVGNDVWVPATLATAFGGTEDRGDNGATASGIRTDRHGGVVGCALPMPISAACVGTPLASFPWLTQVEIHYEGRNIFVPLIDEGPAGQQSPCRMIDLTIPAVRLLTGIDYEDEAVNYWGKHVSFRIIGAAKYQTDYKPSMGSYQSPIRHT